ncbi:toxin TcdB middle/N-terminal domain-containing protein [Streptomyces kebangsaanensis]|uniref:Toxin TcdB middle/N-terminal domain-containing protein n=1 Tax=Streptomyces kebangsaanensis TaxID=864058 RepID=A0ABW6L2P9_9ACTN
MTTSNGTADEVLALPTGGGAVSGRIGGVSVDLNTGEATTSVELDLPAGPNALTPPVTLEYSTRSGDGPFGMGWSLGLMSVRRRVRPAWVPHEPTYELAGVGELVAVGGRRYRPIVDTSGALIEALDQGWAVTDKTDLRTTLGTTDAARVGGAHATAWYVDRCTDNAGHTIEYRWAAAGSGLVPESIAWGTHLLVFRYETRPDVLIDAASGPPVVLNLRCRAIELHETTEAASLVRTWTLGYGDGRSLLTTIEEAGHAADGSTLAAPVRRFGYSRAAAPSLRAIEGLTMSLADPDVDLADLTGDGLPDLVHIGDGPPAVSTNLGDGRFAPARRLATAPAPLRLSAPGAALADMTGNGAVDLLEMGPAATGFYPLCAPNGAGAPHFGRPTAFRRAPAVSPADPRTRLLDLDGDGVTDMLLDTGRTWLVYLRTDADTWSAPIPLPRERTPQVSLADPHVYLADMTGDGRTDVVLVERGATLYWPARADGGWGDPVDLTPTPVLRPDHDPRRLRLVDVDGDGCADLVYVDSQVTIWYMLGATRLSAPQVVAGTPPATPGSTRVADLFGIGTRGIVFALPTRSSPTGAHAYLDLTGGTKPYLLTELSYGDAARTRITHQPSTDFARRDAARGAPWPTYHPFPIQCVARVERCDLGSGDTTTTTYTYHNGRYDPDQRRFLGFGRVVTEEQGDASCPGLRESTDFHLGLDPADPARPLSAQEALELGALRGKPLRTSVYGLDDTTRPYSVTIHTYATRLIPAARAQTFVVVPFCASSTEQRWERHGAPISTRTVSYLEVTDEGDVLVQRTAAVRAGRSTPDQDVTTTTTLATGGANLRLPARVTQTAPDGTIVSAVVYFYDGDPFVGLPEGRASTGYVSRIEDRVLDDAKLADAWGPTRPDLGRYGYHRLAGDPTGWWRVRVAYRRGTDVPGPPSPPTYLSSRGPLGAEQTLHYDAVGEHVVAVTDAVGNRTVATIDARTGQTATVTDANGRTAGDRFDALGRVVATLGALDRPDVPGRTFTYSVGAISVVESTTRITAGADTTTPTTSTIAWVDGSGRTAGAARPAPDPGVWIVTGVTERNPRGLVTTAYQPYPQTRDAWRQPPTGTRATRLTYDALGRTLTTTRPDGLTITTRHDHDDVVISETWPGDPARDVERQTFDAAGRLVAVARRDGDRWVSQAYSYNAAGTLVGVTEPDGTLTTFVPDLLGRTLAHRSTTCGTTRFLLDTTGHQRMRTNALGQTVRTETDAMNRITDVFYDDETRPRAHYDYLDTGAPAPADGVTADRIGRLWRVTDELGTLLHRYDALGRITSTTRTLAEGGAAYTNEATYDGLGRPVTLTLPASSPSTPRRTITYTYGPDGSPVSASGVVERAAYDRQGHLTAIHHSNGSTTTYDDGVDRTTTHRVHVVDTAGATLRDVTATRARGLVTDVASRADDDTVTFTYDGLRRLVGVHYGNSTGAGDDRRWSYNDAFDLVGSTEAGSLSYTPGTHRLTTIGTLAVMVDAAGRRTGDRFGTAVFDAADHLAELVAPDGTHHRYVYDHSGHLGRASAGVDTHYLSPLANVEVRNGHTVVWIAFGDRRIAAEVDGRLITLHPDALGVADLLTDEHGHLLGRAARSPYGAARGPDPGPPGEVLAALLRSAHPTGLVLLGHRWYDPLSAQFLSPDPVISGVFALGAMHPYLLCLGNPVTFSDPEGTSAFWKIVGEIGIGLLAAAAVTAAVFTGGLSLVALGVISENIGGFMLAGVAVASLGGAAAGEIAAAKAGGNLWAGAFVGALAGGTAALVGAAVGGVAAGAIDSLMAPAATSGHTFLGFVAAGTIQGAVVGAGTGAAAGFRGGGPAERIVKSLAYGAAWGAAFGALVGAGVGGIVGTGLFGEGHPDNYANWFHLKEKFLDSSDLKHVANSVDNQWGAGLSVMQLTQGVDFGSTANVLVNFISTGPKANTILSIPLFWVEPAFMGGGFAGAVNITMELDQAGISYATQMDKLIGAVPYFVDFAYALWQISDPGPVKRDQHRFDNVFGSAES